MVQQKYSDSDAQSFLLFFNRPLHRFWDGPFGFDIIKFDDFLAVPSGQSTDGFLLDNYGEDARDLIKGLL